MTLLDPHDPRAVAEWAARAVEAAGHPCKLWMTRTGGGAGWWCQPSRPSSGSARCYVEVAEVSEETAHQIIAATTEGWWALGRLAQRVQDALSRP